MLNSLKKNLYATHNKKPKKSLGIFFSLLKKKNANISSTNTENENTQIKHYLPSTKEWYNSIYAYNKNTLNLLPIADKVILKLIKSYFNLYSKMLNYKIRYRKLRVRIRRISSHRIYVSKAELRHIFDRLSITIYIFNRQKYNFFSKIKKKVLRKKYITKLKKDLFKSKISLIKTKGLDIIKKIINEKKLLIQIIAPLLYNFKEKKGNKNIKTLNLDTKTIENIYYKNYIKKSLKREIFHIFYKQILYLNKSKFENTYLHKLSSLIKMVYNKNIEFNIVNLKYFFLNSEIFSESIAIKLRKRKNRLLKVLKKSLAKVKIADLNSLENSGLYNIKQNLKKNQIRKDPLNNLLYRLRVVQDYVSDPSRKFKLERYLENLVINFIKYKAITGVRLEAAGRLTRRITASRSVFKIRYKGNLKNTDSSVKGLSSPVARGVAINNLQYSIRAYKTRIGAFGLKSWVSSNSFSTKAFNIY